MWVGGPFPLGVGHPQGCPRAPGGVDPWEPLYLIHHGASPFDLPSGCSCDVSAGECGEPGGHLCVPHNRYYSLRKRPS